MLASTNTPDEAARRRLLEEGVRSYLKAVGALTAFEQEVQRVCVRIFKRNLSDYASAIDLRPQLLSDEIEEYIWPKPGEWEGWRSVGAGIQRKQAFPGLTWWNSFCALYWEEGTEEVCCWVGEAFPRRVANSVVQKLSAFNEGISDEGEEVGVFRMIKADEANTFGDVLDELFRQWTELWRKVGGMKAVLKGD